MSESDFVLNATGPLKSSNFNDNQVLADEGEIMLKKIINRWRIRWRKSQPTSAVPPGHVRQMVTQRLHERELFLDEVRGQLRQLEASVDELTDTIHSMQKF